MPEALWTADEIVDWTDGTANALFDVGGVSIDTRTLKPGDLFVALAGERDGHEFVGPAMAKGAAGALVSRSVDAPSVVVHDTLAGLEALAVGARERAERARRAAVTGSVGKTSLTQAIAAGLRLAGPAHSSVKSYNNHIGVPLTLARMPRDTRRAVFEIGMNHAGEIGPLSRMVRPHVALVTVVGPVHVENFADGEAGVARAKAEIFAGLEPGGVAVLNADDKWFGLLADAARAHGAEIRTFGSSEACDARLVEVAPNAPSGASRHLPRHAGEESLSTPLFTGELSAQPTEGAFIRAVFHGQALDFPIAQAGAHWGLNSLAALLVLEALDVPLETGLAALAEFAPLEGRGLIRTVEGARGRFTLIDESYNANPLSMRAALAALAARPVTGRRIAVLTDMLELGADAPAVHAALAEPIEAAHVDLVFCAGPLMKALWDALPAARRGGWAETASALAPKALEAVRDGDAVMVKGSNGSRASLVVQALMRAGEPVPASVFEKEGEGR